MEKQLSHISIYQTSKVFAIIYFVLAALVCVPMGLYMIFFAEPIAMGIMMLFVPFLHALVVYIFTAIVCWFYNIIARTFGGIEFTLKDV